MDGDRVGEHHRRQQRAVALRGADRERLDGEGAQADRERRAGADPPEQDGRGGDEVGGRYDPGRADDVGAVETGEERVHLPEDDQRDGEGDVTPVDARAGTWQHGRASQTAAARPEAVAASSRRMIGISRETGASPDRPS
jgi:hypothetical protein